MKSSNILLKCRYIGIRIMIVDQSALKVFRIRSHKN